MRSCQILAVTTLADANSLSRIRPSTRWQLNYINAVDGRQWIRCWRRLPFLLKASIQLLPRHGGSPGEIICGPGGGLRRLSFIGTVTIGRRGAIALRAITASRQLRDLGHLRRESLTTPAPATSPSPLPNWVRAGSPGTEGNRWTTTAKTSAASGNRSTLLGPQITVSTPTVAVLANQRVSLVGTGFSPGCDDRQMTWIPELPCRTREISIGGVPIDGGESHQ